MEAILKFTLPEENQDYLDAVNGSQWKTVVWKMDRELRAIEKHGDDAVAAEKFRGLLHDLMTDNLLMFE